MVAYKTCVNISFFQTVCICLRSDCLTLECYHQQSCVPRHFTCPWCRPIKSRCIRYSNFLMWTFFVCDFLAIGGTALHYIMQLGSTKCLVSLFICVYLQIFVISYVSCRRLCSINHHQKSLRFAIPRVASLFCGELFITSNQVNLLRIFVK